MSFELMKNNDPLKNNKAILKIKNPTNVLNKIYIRVDTITKISISIKPIITIIKNKSFLNIPFIL